jgi:hypothetical protein
MAKVEKKILTFGDGINTDVPPLSIKDTQYVYGLNMDTRESPSNTVRPPRSTYASLMSSSALSLGQRNNAQLHAVNGVTWQYWSSTGWVPLTTSLSPYDPAQIMDFVTGATRYTILMNGVDRKHWDGSSTAVALGDGTTPNTPLFTVFSGRVYALSGATLFFSGLNHIDDWTTANDAGSITIVDARGDGTGICTYNSHVIAFTEYSMHELWGTGPPNYDLTDVEGNKGCISHRSIAEANSLLYWLWYGEVCSYGGNTPVNVGRAVRQYLEGINLNYKTGCCAGVDGDFYYLAIPYGSTATGNNLLLKYDTRLNIWNVEPGNFIDFTTIGGTLYGLDNTGQVWNMRDMTVAEGYDSSTLIPWQFITKPFLDNAVGEPKTINDLWLVSEVPVGSLTLGYNLSVNDNTNFTTLATVNTSTDAQNQRIIPPNNAISKASWYKFKFSGSGKASVHYLQKNYGITE